MSFDFFDLNLENLLLGSNFYKTNVSLEDSAIGYANSIHTLYDELEKISTMEMALIALEAKKMKTVVKKGLKGKKKLKKKKKVTREGYIVEVEGDIDGIEGIDYEIEYEDPEISNIVSLEGEIWNKIKDTFSTIWKKFIEMLKRFWEWLKGLFTGNKKKISELERKVRELSSKLGEANSKLEETSDKLNETNSKLGEAYKKLGETNSKLGEAYRKLDEADQRIVSLKEDNMLLTGEIEDLNEELSKKNSELDALKTEFENLSALNNKREKMIESLLAEKFKDTINKYDIEEIEKFINEEEKIKERLNEFIKSIDKSEIDNIKKEVDGLKKVNINKIPIDKIKETQSKLDMILSKVAEIKSIADNYERKFKTITELNARYKEDKTYSKLVNSSMSSIQALIKSVNKINASISKISSKYTNDLKELYNKIVKKEADGVDKEKQN